VAATHEPRVGEEVAHFREAADVVDLVEQDERENLADAGDRTQALVRVAVIDLGVTFEIEFDLGEALIVRTDERQIGLDAQLHRRIVEVIGHLQLLTVGGVGELLGKRRQVASFWMCAIKRLRWRTRKERRRKRSRVSRMPAG
jgi:hypothetical protein